VQRIKAEAKTSSGIFLPESSVKELNEAKVLAVGPGALDKKGNRIAMSVAVGDKVLIPQVRLFWRSLGFSRPKIHISKSKKKNATNELLRLLVWRKSSEGWR